MTWKVCTTTIAGMLLSVSMFAADIPKPKIDSPILTAEQKLALKDKRIELDEILLQQKNLKEQFEQLGQEYQKAASETQTLVKSYQDAIDKDKKTWVLNVNTLTFEPVTADPPKVDTKK